MDECHHTLRALGVLGGIAVDVTCVLQAEPTAVEIEQNRALPGRRLLAGRWLSGSACRPQSGWDILCRGGYTMRPLPYLPPMLPNTVFSHSPTSCQVFHLLYDNTGEKLAQGLD